MVQVVRSVCCIVFMAEWLSAVCCSSLPLLSLCWCLHLAAFPNNVNILSGLLKMVQCLLNCRPTQTHWSLTQTASLHVKYVDDVVVGLYVALTTLSVLLTWTYRCLFMSLCIWLFIHSSFVGQWPVPHIVVKMAWKLLNSWFWCIFISVSWVLSLKMFSDLQWQKLKKRHSYWDRGYAGNFFKFWICVKATSDASAPLCFIKQWKLTALWVCKWTCSSQSKLTAVSSCKKIKSQRGFGNERGVIRCFVSVWVTFGICNAPLKFCCFTVV